MKTKVLLIGLMTVVAAAAVAGERRRRARRRSRNPIPGAKVDVYRTVGDVKLRMHIVNPKGHKPTDKRAAIVFFFGGGFVGGSPRQFAEHCTYFASRGMVAMGADYRVKNRHGTTPVDSVEDGYAAIRWVRQNAKRLGVDPNRIVAAGGSAGGLIGACVGVIPDAGETSGAGAVSSAANAMVLFNPAAMGPTFPRMKSITDAILPYRYLRKGLPPMIMFFGTDDAMLADAEAFRDASVKLGNRCEVLTWEGVGHAFFNYGRDGNRPYVETVRAADRFLASLGYLTGGPTIGTPERPH